MLPEPPPLPDLPVEIRPIPGFAGYAATELGQIYSCRSKWPDRRFPFKDWVLLRATKGIRGYWVIAIVGLTGRRQHKLHQLVLSAFKGPCPLGQQGRHLNDDPDNNHIDNLEWGTPKQNRADLIRNGRLPNRKGMAHPLATITDLDVVLMRMQRQTTDKTLKAIGQPFGLSEAMVSRITNRRSWTHV